MTLLSKEDFLAQSTADTKPTCGICHEDAESPTTTVCNHVYCLHELLNWLESSNICPLCRRELYERPVEEEDDEPLEPYYFRDFARPITDEDIDWRYSALPDIRNWAASRDISLQNQRAHVLGHMNGLLLLLASTGPPNLLKRAYIGTDQDILNRVAAAIRLARPRRVNGLENNDVCRTEWRRCSKAFLSVVDQLRGISVTGSTLLELLWEKAQSSLGGVIPLYPAPISPRTGRIGLRTDLFLCIGLIVKMAQDAYEEKVAAEGLGMGPGAFPMT